VTLRRAAVALAAVSFCLGASSAALAKARKHKHHTHRPRGHGHAASSGPAAEGRAHLKRANALAGDGDCEAAIEEYTKAYELLEDPVVLFNRGECYRRTGDSENAADDYHAFLDKVPNAPNRADIEAKIVALEAPETPKRVKAPEETGPPPLQTAPPAPKTAEQPPPPPPARAPAPRPVAVVAAEPAAAEEDSGPSRGSRPWVWIALSVLVAGAAVGGYFMFRPHQQTPPDSALGNYRF
jgi:tetratricopeptide (TPR) repeat protein